MNVTGTVLEKTQDNRFYVKFKQANPNIEDEDYQWKTWILKKYFKDNLISEIIKFAIGCLILSLAKSGLFRTIIRNQNLSSTVVISLIMISVVFIGSGIIFTISNIHCLKHYNDYLWDEDAPIVSKIIKYYDKAR